MRCGVKGMVLIKTAFWEEMNSQLGFEQEMTQIGEVFFLDIYDFFHL